MERSAPVFPRRRLGMGVNFEVSLAFASGSRSSFDAANPAAAAVPFRRKSRRRMGYLLVRGRSTTSKISCRADIRLAIEKSSRQTSSGRALQPRERRASPLCRIRHLYHRTALRSTRHCPRHVPRCHDCLPGRTPTRRGKLSERQAVFPHRLEAERNAGWRRRLVSND